MAPEGQETQYGVVLLSMDIEGEEADFHVEPERVPVYFTILEHRAATGSTGEGCIQAILGNRMVGRQVGLQRGGMRPRDRPTERTGSMGEPPEEPIVIEMSMDGPDEAGANPRSQSPEYENLEVLEVLMDEAEAEEEMNKNKKPRGARTQEPGTRSQGEEPGAQCLLHPKLQTQAGC